MKFTKLAVIVGISLCANGLMAQEAIKAVPIGEGGIRIDRPENRCESEKLIKIVDAVQCAAQSCPDPTGEKKKIYEDICTIAEAKDGATAELAPAPKNGLRGDAQLIFPIEGDQAVVTPPNTKLLTPCECLEYLKKRTECEIELCKPEEPKQPEQPNTPDIPKDVTPDTPKEATGPKQFMFEGSGCNLGAAGSLTDFAAWASMFLLPVSALALRRKKK